MPKGENYRELFVELYKEMDAVLMDEDSTSQEVLNQFQNAFEFAKDDEGCGCGCVNCRWCSAE